MYRRGFRGGDSAPDYSPGMVSALRRLFWLALLGGAGFAGWSLWNSTRREPAKVVEPAVTTPPVPQAFVEVAAWVTPGDDGSCPASHPVKANDNSGIFHVPGGRFYDRTRAERCYSTADAAQADGYRAAKS